MTTSPARPPRPSLTSHMDDETFFGSWLAEWTVRYGMGSKSLTLYRGDAAYLANLNLRRQLELAQWSPGAPLPDGGELVDSDARSTDGPYGFPTTAMGERVPTATVGDSVPIAAVGEGPSFAALVGGLSVSPEDLVPGR